MKQTILFVALAFVTLQSKAQSFNFQLTGNPINTTGWTITGSGVTDATDPSIFDLTTSQGDQSGSIYYGVPQTLTACSQFTVSFQFRITNSSSPTADGIAFYYISNPPTGFTNGEGLGLPNDPNGLVLLFDTYDNNSTPDNPLVALFQMDGTFNYNEGSTPGELGPQLSNQNFITDGNWHTCVMTYYFGTITVAFDGNPPVITTTTSLALTGYFGFCASTGGSWSTQSIKNVIVTGAPAPTTPVGNDVSYCQGTTVGPLTATGNSLQWYTTPTGGTALPAAPVPSTVDTGTFYWYVSSGTPGCNLESPRDTVSVIIKPQPPEPNIYIPPYCSGQTASAIDIISGTNVLWYTAATGGVGSATIPTINTSIADTTIWYATQTSAGGCESNRAPVTAIVRQAPVVNFTDSLGLACGTDTVHFINTTTNASSYFWNFGDGFNSQDSDVSHVYVGQGTFNVTLRAYNTYCIDSITKPVAISHPIHASFTASDTIICAGTQLSFTNSSTVTTINNIGPSYLWIFGDGTKSGIQNAVHSYANAGTYQVYLVASNAIPCYDTASIEINVDSMPSITFKANDTAICMGDNIGFTAQYTLSGFDSLKWNFGDSPDNTALNTNPTIHAYDQPGTYTVSVFGNYRACPDITGTIQITVNALPVINLGPDTSLCLGGAPITLSDNINASNPSATWLWSTGATTSSIIVKQNGVYTATVTINQCSTSDEVNVSKNCYIDIPNAFTPNNDGVNDYFFPRQFLSDGVDAFTMDVFDRWGEKIFETTNANGRGWDGKFNGKDQPDGVYVYMIQVILKNGRSEQYNGNVTLLR